jgi:hypothetical protein
MPEQRLLRQQAVGSVQPYAVSLLLLYHLAGGSAQAAIRLVGRDILVRMTEWFGPTPVELTRQNNNLPEGYTVDAAILYGAWADAQGRLHKLQPALKAVLGGSRARAAKPLGEQSVKPPLFPKAVDNVREIKTLKDDGTRLTAWLGVMRSPDQAHHTASAARRLGAKKLIVIGTMASLRQTCPSAEFGPPPGVFTAPTKAYPYTPNLGTPYSSREEKHDLQASNHRLRQSLINRMPFGMLPLHLHHIYSDTTVFTSEIPPHFTPDHASNAAARLYGGSDMATGMVFEAANHVDPDTPWPVTPVPAASLLYVDGLPYAQSQLEVADGKRSLFAAQRIMLATALQEIREVPQYFPPPHN